MGHQQSLNARLTAGPFIPKQSHNFLIFASPSSQGDSTAVGHLLGSSKSIWSRNSLSSGFADKRASRFVNQRLVESVLVNSLYVRVTG